MAGHPTANGYRLEVTCPCTVVFERWVFPERCGCRYGAAGAVELITAACRARIRGMNRRAFVTGLGAVLAAALSLLERRIEDM